MCRRARHVRPTDTSAANYWEKTKVKGEQRGSSLLNGNLLKYIHNILQLIVPYVLTSVNGQIAIMVLIPLFLAWHDSATRKKNSMFS